MRKYPSSIMVGFLLGGCSGMAELQLLLFVIFQYYVETSDDSEKSADQALAAFNFLLFVCFGLFSVVLYRHRDAVVIATSMPSGGLASQDDNVGMGQTEDLDLDKHGSPPASQFDA
eukprot:scaffold7363_cov263-Pinguiococcus_pyrenoidosus.AAC.12